MRVIVTHSNLREDIRRCKWSSQMFGKLRIILCYYVKNFAFVEVLVTKRSEHYSYICSQFRSCLRNLNISRLHDWSWHSLVLQCLWSRFCLFSYPFGIHGSIGAFLSRGLQMIFITSNDLPWRTINDIWLLISSGSRHDLFSVLIPLIFFNVILHIYYSHIILVYN